MEARGGSRKYVVLASPSLARGFVILGNERVYMIGRATGSQVLLPGDDVSRKHARIEGEGTTYSIVDLGATNRTLVNDEALTPNQARKLASGDRITIGQHKLHLEVVEGTRDDVATRFDNSLNETDAHALTLKKKQAHLAGVLSGSNLLEVCQLIELNKHSGDLRVTGGALRGSIRFKDGTIVDARCGVLSGERAARTILGFTSGDYAFDQATGEAAAGPLTLRVTSLTMDILRARDEAQAGKSTATLSVPKSGDESLFLDEAPAVAEPAPVPAPRAPAPAAASASGSGTRPAPVVRPASPRPTPAPVAAATPPAAPKPPAPARTQTPWFERPAPPPAKPLTQTRGDDDPTERIPVMPPGPPSAPRAGESTRKIERPADLAKGPPPKPANPPAPNAPPRPATGRIVPPKPPAT